MEKTITKPQLKKLHALLNNAGMMEEKRDLILHYTHGRTSSARELFIRECEELIDHLQQHDAGQKMRMKIYSLGYDLGIIYSTENAEEKKINKAALDAWLIRNSYLHKTLSDYNAKELPKLVSQLQQVLKHNQQSAMRKEAKKSVDSLLNELGIPSETR